MSKRLLLFVSLALVASTPWAETFKCRLADGRVAFQDHPCPSGSAGGQVRIDVTPPSGDSALPSRPSAAAREFEAERQRSEAARVENQKAEAHNRAVRCNAARHDLGVLKLERPVFRYDNKGDRHYVDDSRRQAEIAAAQRRVAEHCK